MLLHPACPLLDIHTTADATVVRFREKQLGEPYIEAIGEELFALVETTEPRTLRLNLSGVHSISSDGLSVLIRLNKQVREADGKLTLENVNPLVYEVFAVTHVTNFLDVRRA